MSTAAETTTASVGPVPGRERLLAWNEILETANPPQSRPLVWVGKRLVITRAAVFPGMKELATWSAASSSQPANAQMA